MVAGSQSVVSAAVSAAERTAMTTNTVPCRIQMLPKIHRLPRNNNKSNKKTPVPWKNPKKKKTKTHTINAVETPVKRATISRASTPSTSASSNPGSPVESRVEDEVKPRKECAITSLPPRINIPSSTEATSNCSPAQGVNKDESATSSSSSPTPPAIEDEVKPPRKQCAITSLPKVHRPPVRAPPAPSTLPCSLHLPVQEISFAHSDQDGSSNNIAKTLMFGEDEGFEDMILNESINRDELVEHQDDQFLRRNLVSASPQPTVDASMETELRRNREKLDTSFPQQNPVNYRDANNLSFETTFSMEVNDRMHFNESPIRPIRHVVGEETIMDTSREVEMVRNSFFDNEELVAELEAEKKAKSSPIPKEISLFKVLPAVVDFNQDFVSPMQRLREARKSLDLDGNFFVSPMQRLRAERRSLELPVKEEKRVATDNKKKRMEAKRKANVVKHMAAERRNQEAANVAKAKKEEEEAMVAATIVQAKQQEAAEKKASAAAKARHETNAKKQQAEQQKRKQAEKVRHGTHAKKKQAEQPKKKQTVKKQPQEKKALTSSPPSIEKPTATRPSSPQTPTTGPFVPEWAKKSLRKTTSPSTTFPPVESAKSTVSSSSSFALNEKKLPEWANKQLRKSTVISRASVQSCSGTSSVPGSVISDELSSWMGKRRRASEGIQVVVQPEKKQ